MDIYRPSSYGDAFADVYDEWYATVGDDEVCLDALTSLAAGGRVLELGVGTGRLALPLARRGLVVTGIDASPAMLRRLVVKQDAAPVRVIAGDMAELPCAGLFGLVFVAYNTFFNLPDERAQQRSLESVARVLDPDGVFAIEAFVPPDPDDAGVDRPRSDAARALSSPGIEVRPVEDDRVVLTAAIRDVDAQTITGEHIEVTLDSVRRRPWRVHYLFPDQLDRLAARAGLELVARHADWGGSPFGAESPTHVSQYRFGPVSSRTNVEP